MSDADIRDVATEYFTHDSNAESRPNANSLFTHICDIVNERRWLRLEGVMKLAHVVCD